VSPKAIILENYWPLDLIKIVIMSSGANIKAGSRVHPHPGNTNSTGQL